MFDLRGRVSADTILLPSREESRYPPLSRPYMFSSLFLLAAAAGTLLHLCRRCLRRQRAAMLVYDEEANRDSDRKNV